MSGTAMLFDVRGGRDMKLRCESCREVLTLEEDVRCTTCEQEEVQAIWDEQN